MKRDQEGKRWGVERESKRGRREWERKGTRKGVRERDKETHRGNMNAAETFVCTIQ